MSHSLTVGREDSENFGHTKLVRLRKYPFFLAGEYNSTAELRCY